MARIGRPELIMVYRVDYLFALLLAGGVLGVLLARRAPGLTPARAAQYYFVGSMLLLGGRCLVCVVRNAMASGPWSMLAAGFKDAAVVFLGALIGGAAASKSARWAVLSEPPVLSALCISTGVSFAMPFAFGSSPSWKEMASFFTLSGYSTPLLRFIMTVEVLGGLALLVDWMVPFAVVGLTLDMFGAIYTHAYNGDSIHDDMDAFERLVRLGLIATLWLLHRRRSVPGQRSPLVDVAMGAVACAVAAVAGGTLLHAQKPPAPSAPAPADGFDYFAGDWSCAGQFASGRPIESDVHFERTLNGGGLLLRHDDRPPNQYHAVAQWLSGTPTWTATVHDSFGGARAFHTSGWDGDRLVWEGMDLVSETPRMQHFIFQRLDPTHFESSYEVERTSGDYRHVDRITCTRTSPAGEAK
ncbi:DoxX family protein [Pendulispora rubella]|uniref:DoxX family protein n=1 Tax=Pendulispora rubella TaxID=2741070 RepID=A0ABZ2KS51_9BACT